jgi:hypothetical protein
MKTSSRVAQKETMETSPTTVKAVVKAAVKARVT